MADTNTIGVRMTMDAQQYHQELNRITREMAQATQEFSKATSTIDKWQNSIQGTQARITLLNERIRLQEERLSAANARLSEMVTNEKTHARTIESQEKTIEKMTTQLNRYRTQLGSAQENLAKLVVEEEKNNSVMGQLNSTYKEQKEQLDYLTMQYQNAVVGMGEMSSEAQNLKAKIQELNAEMEQTTEQAQRVSDIGTSATSGTTTTGSIAMGTMFGGLGFTAVTRSLSSLRRAVSETIDTFITFESAFTSVRKTVEGSEQDFNKLENELKVLGTQLATPIDEIANIASIAGQMGIAVDDISEFTRVMIQLGDSTNISAQEAGQSLAQLSNLLGLTADEYERLGSTIVELGNNYPTTEQDIVNLSQRLAGMAGQVSMTAADVLGLANALSSVGLEAEMGGNTIAKTLRDMLTAVENGTESLSIYAQTANMTVDEFVKLFKDDATGALTAFVRGLGDLSSQGKSVTGVLNSLGTTQTRQVDTLLRLASNSELLAESVAVANNAWDDNVALAREAAMRYETLESRIEMMKNAWRNVAIDIGTSVQPVLRGVVDLATDFANFLSGNKTASYELETQFRNLTAALADYKEAQEEAQKATENHTAAMVFAQDTIALINQMETLGETMNKSWDYLNGQARQYDIQLDSISSAQESAINRANQLIGGRNFTSYDELLGWFTDAYASGSTDANWYILKDYIDSVAALEDDLKSIGNNISNTYANIIADAQNFGEAMADGQITDNMLQNWLSNIKDKDSRALMESFIQAFRGLSGEGVTEAFTESLTSFSKEELEKMAESYEESLTEMILSGDINVDLASTFVTAISAIEDYIKTLKTAQDETAELQSLNESGLKTIESMRYSFQRDLGQQQDYNLVFGITGESAASSEMSKYTAYISNIISAQYDYAEALNMVGASQQDVIDLYNEWTNASVSDQTDILARMGLSQTYTTGQFDEILGNWFDSFEEIDKVMAEYYEKYGQYITELGSFDSIMAYYAAENEKIIANMKELGDEYDYTTARVQLLNNVIAQLQNLSPEDRDNPFYSEWLRSLLDARNLLYQEVETTAKTDADKLRETYATLLTQESNLTGLSGELYDTGSQKVVSGAKSLLGQLLGIDKSTLSEAERQELEAAIDDIGRMIQQYGEKTVKESIGTVGELYAEFQRALQEQETYNLSVGVEGDEAESTFQKHYESYFSSVIELCYDYVDALNLTGKTITELEDITSQWMSADEAERLNMLEALGIDSASMEEADAYFTEIAAGFESINKEREDYIARFKKDNEELSSFEKIMQEYNTSMDAAADNFNILGDESQYLEEELSAVRTALNKLLALPVEERTEDVADQIQKLTERYKELNEQLNATDPMANIEKQYQALLNMESLIDSGKLSEDMQTALENAYNSSGKSLFTAISKIDYDSLTTAGQETYDTILDYLSGFDFDLSSAGSSAELTWWGAFKEKFVNESVKEFGEGLEEMTSDLVSVWNTIGGTILDTIDMWLDAQIEAIERAIDELEDALEREEEVITYAANKRQAELNAQLEAGLITEEQYNLASVQNKNWAEAAKQEAEEETANKKEELEDQLEELERKQFEQDKINSIAQVWINAAQGISAAWGTGNPIYAGIVTGLISAMAAVQTGIISSQQYTALAKGGVVDSPTMALIGEAGTEAVMPLENNTEWIAELADQISSLMDTPQILGVVDKNSTREDESSTRVSTTQNFTQVINSPKALSRKEIYRDTRKLFKQFGRS